MKIFSYQLFIKENSNTMYLWAQKKSVWGNMRKSVYVHSFNIQKHCLNLLIARCENEALNLLLLLLLRAESPIEIVKQNWGEIFSKVAFLLGYQKMLELETEG